MIDRASWVRITLLALIVLVAASSIRAEDPLCVALDGVVEAAAAGNSFADLTGADAGTHQQAAVRLPDAAWCLLRPNDRPPTYRCLMANEDRYQSVFKKQNKHADRVAACLGEGWTRSKESDTAYLREITFSHASGVEVVVLATNEVAEEKGWQRYRIVLLVRAPAR